MSPDALALVAGTLLAVGALAYVLYPLFFPAHDIRPPADDARDAGDGDSAIVALREIEFDRATGKLSDADYAELKRAYAGRALQEMRETGHAAGVDAGPLDAIEAQVRAFRRTHRECATCGVRPEPDAMYCSTCGAWLDRACRHCGATVPEAGATFCSTCGVALASARPAPAAAAPRG